MMKKTLSIIALIPFLALFSACSNDSAKCSDSSTLDECQRNLPDVDTRPLTLQVQFKDSHFFDQNSQTWKTITKENLDGGIIGMTLPIYSTFLNQPARALMPNMLLASDQVVRRQNYSIDDYNKVPFIEVAHEEGVDYIYNYTKMDLNGNIVTTKVGKMIIEQGRAILPLINESFDNQFYSSSTDSQLGGSRFIHQFGIAAQSKEKRGTRSINVSFEIRFEIPNTEFYVAYSSQVNNFNLKNRWSHYRKGTDSVTNDSFHFFTLKELKGISEQIPLDIRVTFKSPPEVQMIQELFFEMPFDVNEIQSTGKINLTRGASFYVHKINLKNPNHYGLKFRLNGQNVPIVSSSQLQTTLPAGVPWDTEVLLDFTPNFASVITPLKPVCKAISGDAYFPLQEEGEKAAIIASGGYQAICHKTENTKVTVSPENISNPPFEIGGSADTWFGSFSYVPVDSARNDGGHFYGIRSVTFRMEGCIKVETKEIGSGQVFSIKTKSSPICNTDSNINEGYQYFVAEKTATVFEGTEAYDAVPGLKAILQSFGARPVSITPHFMINGLTNPSGKIF